MQEKISSQTSQSIDVLIQYKKGKLSLAQAEMLFGNLTGLSPKVAKNFLKGLKRENVIEFQDMRNRG